MDLKMVSCYTDMDEIHHIIFESPGNSENLCDSSYEGQVEIRSESEVPDLSIEQGANSSWSSAHVSFGPQEVKYPQQYEEVH